MYKLIAEVLAERLKTILPETIGESQGAFVEDRQILNEVLIANKLVHIRCKEKNLGPLLKIDRKGV